MTRKTATPKKARAVKAPAQNALPTPDDTRRLVVKEVVAIINRRREALIDESNQSFFHSKLDARVDECHAIERDVIKLLPTPVA